MESPQRVDIRKFARLLRHTEAPFTGQPFVPQPWQDDYFDKLFNTLRPDGKRQYQRSFLALPRKSGKTAKCAVIGAYEGFFGPPGGQIIMAAGDRAQAGILFTSCRRYIESCDAMNKRCKIYRNSIVFPATETVATFISTESKTKHGYNPSLVLMDEYHVQKNRDLIDVLESGMGTRDEPLVVFITTAGMDRIGPCYDEWQRAIKVRDGVIDDPTYLPCIYGLEDPSADIFSEETWKIASPNYGVTIQKPFMEREAKLAKESVAQEIKFRTLYLNQWFSTGSNAFFRSGVVDNVLPLKALPVDGRPCYCGIDLSSNTDTTAFVAVWPQEDGTWDVHCRIFIPEVNARKPEAPYLQWERDEYCILTEGDLVDYDVVRQYVLDFCEKYDVKGVGIDRYNATHITTQLIAEGIPIRPFGQGYVSMSSPCKLLENLVLSKRIRLDGNKALAAHLMNMQCRMDPAGNIKPTKEHTQSTQRIDAAVALVMALGVASGEWDGGMDYSDEILVL